MLVKSKSLTHSHMRNCIASILHSKKFEKNVRILDAGCGNGELISYLYRALAQDFPDITFEIYGFDVIDHGVQSVGFLDKTLSMLAGIAPLVNWNERIFFFKADEKWRFDENYFDFIVSNQVLEHVKNKPLFFKNIYFCLKDGGHSFHLAPLIHIIHEGHIYLPFAHRVKSYDFLFSYIKACSRIGIGKFRDHRRDTDISLDDFSERHADYMMFWTSYASQADTLDMAREANLRCDFKFTREFYLLKICQLLGFKQPTSYNINQSSFVNSICIRFFRYLSSVTLNLKKGNIY